MTGAVRSLLPRDFGPVYASASPQKDWRSMRPVFYMRFAHVLAYLAYIFSAGGVAAGLLPLSTVLGVLAAYFAAMVVLFFRSNRLGVNRRRARIAMFLDLAILHFAWAHDPYSSAPTIVMVLIILLGNGLRHGLRFYHEAALAVILLTPLVAWLRAQHSALGLPAEAVFTIGFTLVCSGYGYLLVKRLWLGHQELQSQNRFDEVTGLYGRRTVRLAAEQALDTCRRNEAHCSVLYLDLNNFKKINDRYGHAEGDDALRCIAGALERCLPPDGLLGRYGGDEFVVILPWSEPGRLDRLRGELTEAVRDVSSQWPRTRLGVSIGTAVAPLDGIDIDTLLTHADHDMYRDKRRSQQLANRLLLRRIRRRPRRPQRPSGTSGST